MLYVKSEDPVVFTYSNTDVKTLVNATLKKSSTILSVVDLFECGDTSCTTECSTGVEWLAVFDPTHFNTIDTFSILWEGTDVNDDAFSFEETGITLSYVTDFYSDFMKRLQRSIFDDTGSCDYSPIKLLDAIKYSGCIINNYPPFTDCSLDSLPCGILSDLAKVYLYKAKAGREALETFNYNDIGKSFSVDRSPKLIQLAESLERNAMQLLDRYKKNLRPQMLGVMSRYARRSGSSARTMFIMRSVYRSFSR